jgi:integrase
LPISCPVPITLHAFMRRYLESVRTLLIGREDHGHLWASIRKLPLRYGSVYRVVKQTTCAAFGYEISPHRFRHAAATSCAECDPIGVQHIHELLGHASQETAERYYIHGSTARAAAELQLNIARLNWRLH